MWDKKCHAKPHNLTTESLTLIRKYFKRDFEIFRQAKKDFGQLLKQGMVSPQVPDLCPKGEQCRQGDRVCPFKGCKVPWADMGVGDDYPCITVGCDPRGKKQARWRPPAD